MNIKSKWEAKQGESTRWDRWRVQVLLELRKVSASPGLTLEELGLPIPQDGCCFTFGKSKAPFPVGALFQLWMKDPLSNGACPKCGGKGVAVAFGGLLSVGGYQGLCLGCSRPLFRQLGGLAVVRQHVAPFLEGTPWFVSEASFGASIGSDGKALAAFLGQPKPPKPSRSDAPVVKAGRHRLVVPNVKFKKK